MIEGKDIICFSNDWDSDPLSKKHIMVRLARKNRVLWVNSIGNRNPTASVRDLGRALKKLRDFSRGCRQVSENLTVFNPIAVPFHGNRAARWFNRKFLAWSLRRACKKLRFRNALTWTFQVTSTDIVGSLGEQFTLYHCVDEFSEFDGMDKAVILELERRLIEKSDLVVVSSSRLYEDKSRYNANTFLVTHGVDTEHFRQACSPETQVPEEIAALPRPVIGFYGLIAEWVDLDLIRYLARSRPEWSFVLIGKLETDASLLRDVSNVHFLGRREYSRLPAYCKGFDVAILPFAVNALTLAANPLKLREYLAAGLPVVSTAIPEAGKFDGLVRIGRSHQEFLEHIQSLVREGWRGPRLSFSQAMENESWDRKVEELSVIVARVTREAGRAHQPGAGREPTALLRQT